MTEQNDWAPEPWEYDPNDTVPFGLRAADGVAIFMLNKKLGPIITDADGERIAACVSACAGVPTKWLESLTKGEIKTMIEGLIVNLPEKETPDAE